MRGISADMVWNPLDTMICASSKGGHASENRIAIACAGRALKQAEDLPWGAAAGSMIGKIATATVSRDELFFKRLK